MVENPLINETLLQMKYARVVSLLADTLGITQERALDLFYNSDTYAALNRPESGLYFQSPKYIYSIMENEMKTGRMG